MSKTNSDAVFPRLLEFRIMGWAVVLVILRIRCWWAKGVFVMTHGKAIELFLIDGTPGSMTTVGIADWTGILISARRDQLSQLYGREEANSGRFRRLLSSLDVRRRGKPEVEMEVSSSSIRNRVGSVFNIGYGFLGEACVL